MQNVNAFADAAEVLTDFSQTVKSSEREETLDLSQSREEIDDRDTEDEDSGRVAQDELRTDDFGREDAEQEFASDMDPSPMIQNEISNDESFTFELSDDDEEEEEVEAIVAITPDPTEIVQKKSTSPIDEMKSLLSKYADKIEGRTLDTITPSTTTMEVEQRRPSMNLMNFIPSDEASDPFLDVIQEGEDEETTTTDANATQKSSAGDSDTLEAVILPPFPEELEYQNDAVSEEQVRMTQSLPIENGNEINAPPIYLNESVDMIRFSTSDDSQSAAEDDASENVSGGDADNDSAMNDQADVDEDPFQITVSEDEDEYIDVSPEEDDLGNDNFLNSLKADIAAGLHLNNEVPEEENAEYSNFETIDLNQSDSEFIHYQNMDENAIAYESGPAVDVISLSPEDEEEDARHVSFSNDVEDEKNHTHFPKEKMPENLMKLDDFDTDSDVSDMEPQRDLDKKEEQFESDDMQDEIVSEEPMSIRNSEISLPVDLQEDGEHNFTESQDMESAIDENSVYSFIIEEDDAVEVVSLEGKVEDDPFSGAVENEILEDFAESQDMKPVDDEEVDNGEFFVQDADDVRSEGQDDPFSSDLQSGIPSKDVMVENENNPFAVFIHENEKKNETEENIPSFAANEVEVEDSLPEDMPHESNIVKKEDSFLANEHPITIRKEEYSDSHDVPSQIQEVEESIQILTLEEQDNVKEQEQMPSSPGTSPRNRRGLRLGARLGNMRAAFGRRFRREDSSPRSAYFEPSPVDTPEDVPEENEYNDHVASPVVVDDIDNIAEEENDDKSVRSHSKPVPTEYNEGQSVSQEVTEPSPSFVENLEIDENVMEGEEDDFDGAELDEISVHSEIEGKEEDFGAFEVNASTNLESLIPEKEDSKRELLTKSKSLQQSIRTIESDMSYGDDDSVDMNFEYKDAQIHVDEEDTENDTRENTMEVEVEQHVYHNTDHVENIDETKVLVDNSILLEDELVEKQFRAEDDSSCGDTIMEEAGFGSIKEKDSTTSSFSGRKSGSSQNDVENFKIFQDRWREEKVVFSHQDESPDVLRSSSSISTSSEDMRASQAMRFVTSTSGMPKKSGYQVNTGHRLHAQAVEYERRRNIVANKYEEERKSSMRLNLATSRSHAPATTDDVYSRLYAIAKGKKESEEQKHVATRVSASSSRFRSASRSRASNEAPAFERLYNLSKVKPSTKNHSHSLPVASSSTLPKKKSLGNRGTQERLYSLAQKKRAIEDERRRLKKEEDEAAQKPKKLIMESKKTYRSASPMRGSNVHSRLFELAELQKSSVDDKIRRKKEEESEPLIKSKKSKSMAGINRLYSYSMKKQIQGQELRKKIEDSKKKPRQKKGKIPLSKAQGIYERGMLIKMDLELKREDEGMDPYVSPLLNPLVVEDDEGSAYEENSVQGSQGRRSRSGTPSRSNNRSRSRSLSRTPSGISTPRNQSRIRARSRMRDPTPTQFSFRSPSPARSNSRVSALPSTPRSIAVSTPLRGRSRNPTPIRTAQRNSTKELLRKMESDVDFYKTVKVALKRKEDEGFQMNGDLPPIPSKVITLTSDASNGTTRTSTTMTVKDSSSDNEYDLEDLPSPKGRFLVRPKSAEYGE
ncbi:predicted protein [Chaetoceros tenuissimus]|uniref:Uncharacterized protein n=1 Tax=Chaetoceros tenuissimus TaxID=426638 RepID=A0AAD3H5N9_9STRA|nr:predicted protein [Chaetoceros tenuissimus]